MAIRKHLFLSLAIILVINVCIDGKKYYDKEFDEDDHKHRHFKDSEIDEYKHEHDKRRENYKKHNLEHKRQADYSSEVDSRDYQSEEKLYSKYKEDGEKFKNDKFDDFSKERKNKHNFDKTKDSSESWNDKEYKKKHYNKHNIDCSDSYSKNSYKCNSSPPDHTKYIAMARYVIHEVDWSSLATLSNIPDVKGYPFSNIVSMSDGPVDNSTGIPYFYLTPLDFTSIDLQKDNRCTVTVTLEETSYCAKNDMDPEDPRCARVMLSGKIYRMQNDTQEYAFAKDALFSRHPSMKTLPADHGFYVATLKIKQIVMLDWFGGPKYIPVKEYLAYKLDSNMQRAILKNSGFSKEAMAIQL